MSIVGGVTSYSIPEPGTPTTTIAPAGTDTPVTTIAPAVDPEKVIPILQRMVSIVNQLVGLLSAQAGANQLTPITEPTDTATSNTPIAPAAQPTSPATSGGGGGDTAVATTPVSTPGSPPPASNTPASAPTRTPSPAAPAPTSAASQAKQGVLLIGDSLTVGTKQYMPKTIGGAKVTIDATSGISLQEGMRRYDAVKNKPRVVEMALFTNNSPKDIDALRQAIKKTIADARARGGKVVWATIHAPSRPGSYHEANELMRKLAAENPDVMGLVDWSQMIRDHPSYLAGDGIHATAAGYEARAKAFAKAAG